MSQKNEIYTKNNALVSQKVTHSPDRNGNPASRFFCGSGVGVDGRTGLPFEAGWRCSHEVAS